ncbi:carotenoid biosynthesis protein [Spirulina subsalsa FACHB-351]|uniref:Carotenoid biosynthesis protein n=1 Tax=Spirulina subsalsa FACHB-351 TaxID=234711 RepID=A0ABT3L135_9CYAN|nr:carotenoid biosynthesis protein [Spirulina subsalsa]MCW6034902.1 carotenoid biosynthesis protein [Spirulina subsalsa FACHB-351]
MKKLVIAERSLLVGHIISMVFGLAGLLIVLPNAQFIASLSEFGQLVFRWSMAGGGASYMVLATAAVAIYAYRLFGLRRCLTFMVPAVFLSLGSELLGTSTGFPFGHYRYLSGLGYKIAGLVPFTIPLSWFYLGFSAYLLVRVGLESRGVATRWSLISAIALGSLLLTSWDFVLDPAMSQTSVPFWIWEQPGGFFGMPYQNFAGWFGTGVVFMTVATLLWPKTPLNLSREQLIFPLVVYVSNLIFATVMSVGSGFWIPALLGWVVGVIPAIAFFTIAKSRSDVLAENLQESVLQSRSQQSPTFPAGLVK